MKLNAHARHALAEAGITQADYQRGFYGRTFTVWPGDACGCPDDRCRGHHHDANEECGCIASLIREHLAEHTARALTRATELA